MKFKEVIVVEGRDDRSAVLQAVDADIIETGGSALPEHVVEQIRLAQQRRGVIILTDPDSAGERIRTRITGLVPGCKHAFLKAKDARTAKGIGVEYARPDAIREALSLVRDPIADILPDEIVEWDDLMEAGMIIHEQAASRRAAIGEALRTGYANGKQFYKRCLLFHITKEEFWRAVYQLDGVSETGE